MFTLKTTIKKFADYIIIFMEFQSFIKSKLFGGKFECWKIVAAYFFAPLHRSKKYSRNLPPEDILKHAI